MAYPSLPIIILAAGASSRMRGRDKLMEDIDGTTLLRRQAEKAIASTTGSVLITLPPAPHPRYAVLQDLNVMTIPVPDAHLGMSASLKVGFEQLQPNTPLAMVLLADLPDVTVEDLRTVANAADVQSDILIWRGATVDRAPGHPIIFRSTLFDAITTLTGDTGGREVVAMAKGRVKLIPLAGNRARCDLDTPEDWAAWRAAKTK